MKSSAANFNGIGLAPEGINQNHVVYELASEMAWHNTTIDLAEWISNFVESRYHGSAESLKDAWESMTDLSTMGVYTQNFANGEGVSGYVNGTWCEFK